MGVEHSHLNRFLRALISENTFHEIQNLSLFLSFFSKCSDEKVLNRAERTSLAIFSLLLIYNRMIFGIIFGLYVGGNVMKSILDKPMFCK